MIRALLAAMCGAFLGWILAHSEVATECRRIGWFFVSKSLFHCSEQAND